MFFRSLFVAIFSIIAIGLPSLSRAHELWIEPELYQLAKAAPFSADFMNGEEFTGIKLGYFERETLRFETSFGGQISPVSARSGDRPALAMTAPDADGLLSVVYETTPAKLTYKEWAKFQKFAAHKDFTTAEADHLANGWPQQGFRESYTRHAKALIAVGTGIGMDQKIGMATEFTALTNPYAPTFQGVMRVLLTYNGAPRPDAQVEVFARAPDKTVKITLHRTDASGIATVPVIKGQSYLFDAVVLRPATDAQKAPNNPLWETLWAALTFHVPE